MTERKEKTIAVLLNNVSKIYPLYHTQWQRAADLFGLSSLIPTTKKPLDFHTALNGVDLTVERGQKIGIIGRNGAGKTTLLKLISQTISPSQGTLETFGSVYAMMQAGLGFHPEFTGMENIRSSLQYNGMTKEQLETAVKDIIDFVELDAFLDQPLRTYSLGMMTRLQFAVATAITPEILIVDEVLGAGDQYFSAKCSKRMEHLIQQGCTLILVSHDLQQVLQYCDQAIWIHQGKIHQQGPAHEVISDYEVYLHWETERHAHKNQDYDTVDQEIPDDTNFWRQSFADGTSFHRWKGSNGVKIDQVTLNVASDPTIKNQLTIDFTLKAETTNTFQCEYLVTLWTPQGKRVARIQSPIDTFTLKEKERRPVKLSLTSPLVANEEYKIAISIYDRKNFSSTAHGTACCYDIIRTCQTFRFGYPTQQFIQSATLHPASWTLTHTQTPVMNTI